MFENSRGRLMSDLSGVRLSQNGFDNSGHAVNVTWQVTVARSINVPASGLNSASRWLRHSECLRATSLRAMASTSVTGRREVLVGKAHSIRSP